MSISRINSLPGGTDPHRAAALAEIHTLHGTVLDRFSADKDAARGMDVDPPAANPTPKQALVNPRIGSRHWLLRKLLGRGSMRSTASPFENHPGTPQADSRQMDSRVEAIPSEIDAPLLADKTAMKHVTNATFDSDAVPMPSRKSSPLDDEPLPDLLPSTTQAQQQRARWIALFERTLNKALGSFTQMR